MIHAFLAAALPLASPSLDEPLGVGLHACDRDTSSLVCAFTHRYFVRTLVGLGDAPDRPADDSGAGAVLTFEWGAFPLGNVLGTGLSVSSFLDTHRQWSVTTAGLFAKVDLTYLFISGLWAVVPDPAFPFRLQLGGRLGLAASESFRPKQDVPDIGPYVLARPEVESFVDFELPQPSDPRFSLLGRGALDTSVNLSTFFRWSFSFGVSYGWDP
jgi:hypothetical protein